MKLKLCTITGADDKVEVSDLIALSARFPFVEWGILFSPKHEGIARYPKQAWVESFLSKAVSVNRSAHLCGGAIKGFAEADPDLLSMIDRFQRIQLNFNASRPFFSKENGLSKVVSVSRIVKPFVITQFNEPNRHVFKVFTGMPGRRGVLFDASGGNGVAPEAWPEMLPNIPCGFAGGLNPDNVTSELTKISAIVGDRPFWIDMESGVRTEDNELDLAKVESVLSQVERFL